MLTSLTTGLASSAAGQGLDALISPGALAKVHSELKGIRNCSSCHVPGKGIADEKCLACHEELRERIRADRGFHRNKTDCAVCHAEHQGEAFDPVSWDRGAFDHVETGYPLLGRHLAVATCEECHHPPNAPARAKSETFLLNDTRCVACHVDVHRGQLGEDCSECHGLDHPFAEISFDHAGTAFPLKGAHRRVDCENCHENQKWKGLRFAECTDCHRDPHRPSLGRNCRRCHDESRWDAARIDHSRTRFPLEGKHRGVECAACHKGQKFRGLAFDECRDCHEDDTHFGQFEEDCGSCHGVEGFETVSFDHEQSRYPLTGKHADVACEDCHRVETEASFPLGLATAVRYKPLESTCRSCHVDAHYGQLSTECETCHVTEGFDAEHLTFEHDRDARFPLLGKHGGALCEQCHRLERGPFPEGSGLAVRYKPLSELCVSCHDNVHDEAWWRSSSRSLEIDCAECHNLESFELERFDHGRTSFELTGAHAEIACDGCHDFAATDNHRYLLFHETASECADCHRSPHLKGMERCLDCHSTTSWSVGAWELED